MNNNMESNEHILRKELIDYGEDLKNANLWSLLARAYNDKCPPVKLFPKKYRRLVKSIYSHKKYVDSTSFLKKINIKNILMMCWVLFGIICSNKLSQIDIYNAIISSNFIQSEVSRQFKGINL